MLIPNENVQYWSNFFDENILTNIAWLNYPDESFSALIDNLKMIDSTYAEELERYGINFRVLTYGERYCASLFFCKTDIEIDLEEWYKDLPTNSKLRQNYTMSEDPDREEITEALDEFAEQLIAELRSILQKNNVDVKDLNQYVLDDDYLKGSYHIDNLIHRSEDEDVWEFYHKFRGTLVDPSQVEGEIPFDLQDEEVFALAI